MTEIFINAKAATMDEDRPQAEAFAVRDGRFSFVGTGEEARAYARKLEAERRERRCHRPGGAVRPSRLQ